MLNRIGDSVSIGLAEAIGPSQQGPDTAAPCRTAACTATYTYDAQDRLRREVNGHGASTDYTLDAAGNISRELVSGDGAQGRELRLLR